MDNSFFLGFLSTVTFIGVPYVLYRYCYLPWTIMRRDMQAVVGQLEALKADNASTRSEMKLRKALYQGDEELARAEARTDFRRMMKGLGGDDLG